MSLAGGFFGHPRFRRFIPLFSVVLVGIAALSFFLTGRVAAFFPKDKGESSFPAALAEVDEAIASLSFTEAPNAADEIASRLDALENRAIGASSTLSILKRRRALSRMYPALIPGYISATERATRRFPYNQAIAAVSTEALLSSGDTSGAAIQADSLSEAAFLPIAAAAYALSSKLATPQSSASTSNAEAILLSAAETFKGSGASSRLVADAVMLRLLSGDILGALALRARQIPDATGSDEDLIRFLAEFEYDFGDRLQATTLFARLPGQGDLFRRADSAYLSGAVPQAREAWLLSSQGAGFQSSDALYNLAATAPDDAGALAYLGLLLSSAPGYAYAAIRYSRLAPFDEGTRVLDAASRATKDPLIDLEVIRRNADRLGPSRTVASLWLLMNRTPRDLRVARWAAYYMEAYDFQDDATKITTDLRHLGLTETWMDIHDALASIRSGRLDAAEQSLERAAGADGDWRIAANLAVIAEGRRSFSDALKKYEVAASLAKGNADVAEIQLRISGCLLALGEPSGARRALEYALDLDPANRAVRLALKRLSK